MVLSLWTELPAILEGIDEEEIKGRQEDDEERGAKPAANGILNQP